MKFCSECGNKLVNGICPSCKNSDELTTREMIFEGKVHKCPHCGKLMKAFQSKCSCGYELRDAKVSSELKKFITKLEEIDIESDNKSFLKVIKDKFNTLGKKLEPKEDRKINLILNYPVPNTKEDILEFMIYASANMEMHSDSANSAFEERIREAWKSKFIQLYEKAKICFKESQDLADIQRLYNDKIVQKKKKNIRIALISTVVPILIIILILSTVLIASCVDRQREQREEEERNNQTYIWPASGISSYLPEPEIIYGKINYDSNSRFDFDLYQVDNIGFENYVQECRNTGFSIEAVKTDYKYEAYNADGYYLYIYYYGLELDITLYAPITVDISANDFLALKMNNDEAEDYFWDLGFYNIELIETTGNIFIADGEVKSISINGITDFEAGDIFRYNDEVVIEYYK